ncbi:MAG: hypothetical protein J5682_05210 [Prevotella sp.]|nr:hypothetical protein [Prevotella sp.]
MKQVASIIPQSLFAVLLVLIFTSCATMFSGTKADIFIDGDMDEPVTISSSAGEYKDVTLPTLVEVKRRQLNGQHIHVTSEHHVFDDIVLEKTFNEWALVSALVYGTPFFIDLMTNAVSKPKYDQFYITPLDSLPAADSLHRKRPLVMVSTMDAHTRARLRGQQLPTKYPRHEINVSLGLGSNQADRSTKRFVDDIIQPLDMGREGECGDIFGDSYFVGKLEYHYRLNRKWDIGAMAAWGISSESYTNRYYYMDEQHENETPGTYTDGYSKCRSFSFAPSVRYTWYETRTYRLFSRVSLGMMRNHFKFDMEEWREGNENMSRGSIIREESIDKTKWRMAYQLSPIGIIVGGSSPLRFVAEVGYGCLGVCNIGLAFCF